MFITYHFLVTDFLFDIADFQPSCSIYLPLDTQLKLEWSKLFKDGLIAVNFPSIERALTLSTRIGPGGKKRTLHTTFVSWMFDVFRTSHSTGKSAHTLKFSIDGHEYFVNRLAFGKTMSSIQATTKPLNFPEMSHSRLSVFRFLYIYI